MTGLLGALILASTLAAPAAPAAPQCATTAPAKLFLAQLGGEGGGSPDATCSAYCGPLNSAVSCQYSTTCTAVDANCPSEQGYVICDGVYHYCAPCCTDGQIRGVVTGPNCSCPDGMTTPRDRYQCIDGTWEYQFSLCGGPFCQGF